MAIGVMGGTFNPIHVGHLIMAEYVCSHYNLDKVIFIPTGNPPHKSEAITPAQFRYQIVLNAITDNPRFEVSSMETERAGKTYTVDTVTELEKLYPGEKLYYIIGTDSMFDIENWKSPELLKGRITFILYIRHVERFGSVLSKATEIAEKYGFEIEICNGPLIEVSSTMIRMRIRNGLSVKYLVPDSILDMISELVVENETDYEKIGMKVQAALGEKRFRHTLGVVAVAEKLANSNQADPLKIRLAALLHDICKPFEHSEMLKIIGDSGIILDEEILSNPDLLHGHAGAVIAEKEYAVTDPEILDAIRFHTTGRVNMSLLEKVIYLADFIEPGRTFPEVDKIRSIAEKNLDEAILMAMESTISYLNSIGNPIHASTMEARDFLNRKVKWRNR